MSDPWKADEPIREENIINESERDSTTPANDEYKLVKLESDGKLSKQFIPLTIAVVSNSTVELAGTNATVDVVYNHNLEKIPSRIVADNSHISASFGTWVNSGQSCVAYTPNSNSWRREGRIVSGWGGSTSSGSCIGRNGFFGGQIIAVDENTFTVRYTNECSGETVPSGAVRFVIEA